MLTRSLMVGVLVGCGVLSAGAQRPFCDRVKALTEDPSVAAAHWGVEVTTLDGIQLCGVNEAQLFRPASNDKLFTTGTALAMLGADKRFATRVTGKLDASTGVVKGDLTLLGGGDANLDSGDLPYVPPAERPKGVAPKPFAFHDLEDMAEQLVEKGVKTVTGDVVGDDSYFPWEPYAESWDVGDLVWGYGAPVSALTIADNELKLTVTPGVITGMPGRESFPWATVTLDQHGVAYYTVEAEVETRHAGPGLGVQVERVPGTRTLRVYGAIADTAGADVEEIAMDDPAAYAAMAFKGILEEHGIAVQGGDRARHQMPREGAGFMAQLNAAGGSEDLTVAGGKGGGSCLQGLSAPTLATHTSEPLGVDVVLTNKVSQNLHAELLFHQLGRRVFCGQGSSAAGARMVRAYVLHAGVAKDEFVSYDGSGLSGHDLVTPRAIAKFLSFASTQPWFATYKASLPVGGVDGSIGGRFGAKDSALTGKVSAKTGTLGESRALSGYVTTASGQTLVFSVLVDNHLPGTSADRVVVDKIVELVAAQN